MRVTDTKSFIIKAKSIHNDKYDYSLVEYLNAITKVKIICKVEGHGIFEQSPANHSHKTNPCGCPKCGGSNKLTKCDFVENAKKVHGDRYLYDYVVFKNSSSYIRIICKIHGQFIQRLSHHTSGSICPKCNFDNMRNLRVKCVKKFIKDSNIIHGNKYDYSLVEYKNTKTKVKIKCFKHGVFEQYPYNHLQGKGCHKCRYIKSSEYHKQNPTGWSITQWGKKAIDSKSFDSFKVYIIKCWNENEEFYKIGRTYRKVKKRFSGKQITYNYEILNELIFNTAKEAFDKETALKRLHNGLKYIPKNKFNGMHECFSKINFDILN